MNSRERLLNAVENSACLTKRQMSDYLQKKLYKEELYVVEMHLNECAFCNDALEGYGKSQAHFQLLETMNIPQIPVVERVVATKATEKKIEKPQAAPKKTIATTERIENINPFQERPKRKLSLKKIGIAATLVLGLGTLAYFQLNKPNKLTTAANTVTTEENVENTSDFTQENVATIAPSREDSLINELYAKRHESVAQQPAAVMSAPVSSAPAADSAPVVASVAPAPSTAPKAAAQSNIANAAKSATPAVASTKTAVTPTTTNTAKAEKPVAKTVAKPAPAAEKAVTTNKEKAAPQPKYTYSKTTTPNTQTASATANKTTEKPKTNSPKTTANAKPEVKTTTPQKTAATNSSTANSDYQKGVALYNKKQYGAALLYFQSAARDQAFANRKQALSYISKCKEAMKTNNKTEPKK